MTSSEEYFGGEWKPVNFTSCREARLLKKTKQRWLGLLRQTPRTLLLSHHSRHQQFCTRTWRCVLVAWRGREGHKDKCGMLWTVNKSFHIPFASKMLSAALTVWEMKRPLKGCRFKDSWSIQLKTRQSAVSYTACLGQSAALLLRRYFRLQAKQRQKENAD